LFEKINFIYVSKNTKEIPFFLSLLFSLYPLSKPFTGDKKFKNLFIVSFFTCLFIIYF